jgi:8-oxo-dGTP diphosphatase
LPERKDPVPTVDLIVRKNGAVLIEKRGREPFVGRYALPGGHVDYGETVEQTAVRELKEECAISCRLVGIMGVYSDPKRDPRGQRISTVFIADYSAGELKAGDDAGSAEWMDFESIMRESESEFSFDHRKILSDYRNWLKDSRETFWSGK